MTVANQRGRKSLSGQASAQAAKWAAKRQAALSKAKNIHSARECGGELSNEHTFKPKIHRRIEVEDEDEQHPNPLGIYKPSSRVSLISPERRGSNFSAQETSVPASSSSQANVHQHQQNSGGNNSSTQGGSLLRARPGVKGRASEITNTYKRASSRSPNKYNSRSQYEGGDSFTANNNPLSQSPLEVISDLIWPDGSSNLQENESQTSNVERFSSARSNAESTAEAVNGSYSNAQYQRVSNVQQNLQALAAEVGVTENKLRRARNIADMHNRRGGEPVEKGMYGPASKLSVTQQALGLVVAQNDTNQHSSFDSPAFGNGAPNHFRRDGEVTADGADGEIEMFSSISDKSITRPCDVHEQILLPVQQVTQQQQVLTTHSEDKNKRDVKREQQHSNTTAQVATIHGLTPGSVSIPSIPLGPISPAVASGTLRRRPTSREANLPSHKSKSSTVTRSRNGRSRERRQFISARPLTKEASFQSADGSHRTRSPDVFQFAEELGVEVKMPLYEKLRLPKKKSLAKLQFSEAPNVTDASSYLVPNSMSTQDLLLARAQFESNCNSPESAYSFGCGSRANSIGRYSSAFSMSQGGPSRHTTNMPRTEADKVRDRMRKSAKEFREDLRVVTRENMNGFDAKIYDVRNALEQDRALANVFAEIDSALQVVTIEGPEFGIRMTAVEAQTNAFIKRQKALYPADYDLDEPNKDQPPPLNIFLSDHDDDEESADGNENLNSSGLLVPHRRAFSPPSREVEMPKSYILPRFGEDDLSLVCGKALVSAARGANIQTVTGDVVPQQWTDKVLEDRLERGEIALENLRSMREELTNMYSQTKVAKATFSALTARIPNRKEELDVLPPGSYGEQLL